DDVAGGRPPANGAAGVGHDLEQRLGEAAAEGLDPHCGGELRLEEPDLRIHQWGEARREGVRRAAGAPVRVEGLDEILDAGLLGDRGHEAASICCWKA